MRLIFVLLVLTHSVSIAANDGAAQSVGKALVEAIVSNDVVAYSQCWISTRQMEYHFERMGIKSPFENLKQYHANRNKSVAESFEKIQQLIASQSVKRESIQLKSCEAKQVRTLRAPNGVSMLAGHFTIVLTAGNDDWRFEIDDGLFDGGVWYFMDSPLNLSAKDTILHFSDHEKEANKSVNRSGESDGN
jgi:hypothetical protein